MGLTTPTVSMQLQVSEAMSHPLVVATQQFVRQPIAATRTELKSSPVTPCGHQAKPRVPHVHRVAGLGNGGIIYTDIPFCHFRRRVAEYFLDLLE